MSAQIIYDPSRPPVAVLAAADIYKKAQSSQASAPVVQLVEKAGAAVTLHLDAAAASSTFSPLNIANGTIVLRYLARQAAAFGTPLYGANTVEAIQVDFFLDLSRLLGNKDTLIEHANHLNEHLANHTVLVGFQTTVADYAVYEGITTNPRYLVFAKTSAQTHPHLARWIQAIGQLPEMNIGIQIRQKIEKQIKEKKLEKSQIGAGFDVDLPGAEMGKVCTRFPPEPSGYLHIGHVKAAMLNDEIARRFKGKLILRFDDTNPQKEKEEYVENILRDLKTLGIEYHTLTHTSDYFDLIQDYCVKMMKEGKAYVDKTPVEEMRAMRMDGIPSKYRDQPLEENLRLWNLMLKGDKEEGILCCVRAKIDMQAGNKTLRDPAIYRCNINTPHHRTGDKYKAYPTYDFACPIVDSIEGVTHCLRTDEYRDRNEQYYWMIDAMGLRKPHIRDYSRLNFVHTCLSKRKLQWFVDTKRVDGWFDPRFPTVQGIMRRGMTVEALREFIIGQGFSMSQNTMEWDKIWTINKRIIDPIAPRFTAITQDNIVVCDIDNASLENITVPLHQKNASVGTKVITRSNKIYLEQDDAKLIKDGEEVTLMSWGNCIIKKVHRDGERVVRLEATLNLAGDPRSTEKKLTWLDASEPSQKDNFPVTLVELDNLISVPKVEEDMDFEKVVNPDTWFETIAVGEPALRNLQKGTIIQIQRRGYFIVDKVLSPNTPLTLIFIPDGRQKSMSTLSTKVDKSKLMGGGSNKN